MKQFVFTFIILFSLFSSLIRAHTIHVHSRPIKATMTINGFQNGGSGGGPAECDGKFHSDNQLIVALSSRWYDNGKRCFKFIKIHYKGRSVRAKVVDECDSSRGCKNDIVDASKAVWKALRVPRSQWGEAKVTWSFV